MSLPATHIRFALDLKDGYEIKDLEKYISGTSYPDSRYITGIDRALTHGKEIIKTEFATDDFRKGWQAHQVCDNIQNKKRRELFPELFPIKHDYYVEEEWIPATAIKIIQDMDDMQKFNIQTYLKYLEYAHNPNNEKIELVKKSNQTLIDLYKDKKIATIDEYYQMLLAWGVSEELSKKVKEKTEVFLKDEGMLKKIFSMYGEMIKDCEKTL